MNKSTTSIITCMLLISLLGYFSLQVESTIAENSVDETLVAPLTYFRDTETGLCFAEKIVAPDSSRLGVSITNVPCTDRVFEVIANSH